MFGGGVGVWGFVVWDVSVVHFDWLWEHVP